MRIAENNERYWLWLCNIEHVGGVTIKKLLEIFGTPYELYNAGEQELRLKLGGRGAGLTDRVIVSILLSRDEDRLKRLEEVLWQKGIRFIPYESKCYPKRLRQLASPPYGLYIKGCMADITYLTESKSSRTAAIVGARGCTAYGRSVSHSLGYELTKQAVNVVSGMAEGIDGAAHRGAMEMISGRRADKGVPVAVLGCGVDICYPIQNYELYEDLLHQGIVLSEYPPGTRPNAWQFPRRNRIISALADKIIVIEARKKSGSLITVEYGLEQGKDIYAVPGRITDGLSEGCNRLIKEGAGCLTSVENVLQELEWEDPVSDKIIKKQNMVLEKDLELVYSCVDYFPKSVEHIMEETGMEMALLFKNIITLQLMGLITEEAKNAYVRCQRL